MKKNLYVLGIIIAVMTAVFIWGTPESRLELALKVGGAVFLVYYILDIIIHHWHKDKPIISQNDDDFLQACGISPESSNAKKALKIRQAIGDFYNCPSYYIRADLQVDSNIGGAQEGAELERYLKNQLDIDDLPFLFDSWSGLVIGNDLTVAGMIREILVMERKNPYDR